MQRIGLIEEIKPVTVEVAPEGTATEDGAVEAAPEGKKKTKK